METGIYKIFFMAIFMMVLALPVTAGLILADPGYSGIASYGNDFHFTPFTPSTALYQSYVFTGGAFTSFSKDVSQGTAGVMYGYALPGTLSKTTALFSNAMENYYINPPKPITNPVPTYPSPYLTADDPYSYSGGCGTGY